MTYRAEIRDLRSRQFHCSCTDFSINGLGTCKHIESILLQLARRQRAEFKAAERVSSTRVDIVPDPLAGRLRVERNTRKLPSGTDTRSGTRPSTRSNIGRVLPHPQVASSGAATPATFGSG